MRSVLVILAVLLATLLARAESPEDAYIRIYTKIQAGDVAQARGDAEGALKTYAEAEQDLKRLKKVVPTWNPKVVSFRLRYLSQRIDRLQAMIPPPATVTNAVATNQPVAVGPSGTGAGAGSSTAQAEAAARIRQLQMQIQRMQQDNALLNAKLKEALSVQPPVTDPQELARARAKAREAEREIATLRAALEVERARPTADSGELEKLQTALSEADEKIKQQTQAAEGWAREKTLLEQRVADLVTDSEALAALRAENELLKKQAAELATRDAAAEKAQELARLLRQSQAEVTRLEADQDAYQAEKRILEKRVTDLLAAQAGQDARVHQLETERTNLVQERDTARLELTNTVAQLASVRSELQQARTSSAAANQLQLDLRAAQVERDALEQRLVRARARQDAPAVARQLESERDQLRQKLASTQAELVGQRSRADSAAERAQQLRQERESALEQKDTLQQQLETALTNLKQERTRFADTSKAEQERIRQLEQEREFLRDQLDRTFRGQTNVADLPDAQRISLLADQLAGLRARLDAYEAKAVPYTPEELALFRQPIPGVASFDLNASLSMRLPGASDAAPAPRPSRVAPANAREIISKGQAAYAAGHYAEAEQEYLEALKADQDSVFVLANLGSIELALNKPEAAEQHLESAVKLDAGDAFSLTVLGYLRYRQQRFDEALDLLSRAAKADPRRADTQNYLGIALSRKGLRGPAEAALRRAINLDPTYGSAHNNLAVVYLTQKPPMSELARWHYEKALAAGQPRDAEIEKLLLANGIKLSN